MPATDGYAVPELPSPTWSARLDPILRHHLREVMRLDRGLRDLINREMERRFPAAPEGRAA